MVDVFVPFEDKENAANRALGARANIGVKQMSNLHESRISVVSSACSSPNKSGMSSLRGTPAIFNEVTFPAIEPYQAVDPSSLSAAQALLQELRVKQEQVELLEENAIHLKAQLSTVEKLAMEDSNRYEESMKDAETAFSERMEDQAEQSLREKGEMIVQHTTALSEKDAEIERLLKVISEKDAEIAQGAKTRKMIQSRHMEVISNISNAHDSQLEETEATWRDTLEKTKKEHEQEMQERVGRCETEAASKLVRTLAAVHSDSMKQMVELDAAWKLKHQQQEQEIEQIRSYYEEEAKGETLAQETLHKSVLEMEKENFESNLRVARVDAVGEFRHNLKNRLAKAKYPLGCSVCSITFGTFDRKSHCRTCGLLICSHCCGAGNEKCCMVCKNDNI